uniref:F-box domain-containing protein n=1 Tax=Panagrellus redivivus TaxID=6233 RepID=A0A7E4VI02_PANRE
MGKAPVPFTPTFKPTNAPIFMRRSILTTHFHGYIATFEHPVVVIHQDKLANMSLSQFDPTRLDILPDLALLHLAEFLDFDDQINLMEACPRANIVIGRTFNKFTHIQLSDEPIDTFLKAETKQVPSVVEVLQSNCNSEAASSPQVLRDERLFFSPVHIDKVLQLCVNLRSVVLAVKLSGTKPPMPLPSQSAAGCSLFDTSLYSRGGVIAQFFNEFPPERLEKLESVCLNVDLIVECFSELAVPCPTEDLRYAVHYLADKPFQTFIQIGFCANEIRPEDHDTNCMLLGAMHTIAYEMNHYNCKTEIDVGDDELYCDLTVELGNLEYSFAFFYYNPDFCEPGPSSAAGGAIEAPEDAMEIDFDFHPDDPIEAFIVTERDAPPGIDINDIDFQLFEKHHSQLGNILNAPFSQKIEPSTGPGYL